MLSLNLLLSLKYPLNLFNVALQNAFCNLAYLSGPALITISTVIQPLLLSFLVSNTLFQNAIYDTLVVLVVALPISQNRPNNLTDTDSNEPKDQKRNVGSIPSDSDSTADVNNEEKADKQGETGNTMLQVNT
jgi:hypothetical protein